MTRSVVGRFILCYAQAACLRLYLASRRGFRTPIIYILLITASVFLQLLSAVSRLMFRLGTSPAVDFAEVRLLISVVIIQF